MSSEAERQNIADAKTAQILNLAVGQVSNEIGQNYDRWLSKIEDLQKWPPREVARRYQAIPAMLAFLKVLQESGLPESLLEKAEGAFTGQANSHKGLEAAFQTICAELYHALKRQEGGGDA